jgi:hypothetical protein
MPEPHMTASAVASSTDEPPQPTTSGADSADCCEAGSLYLLFEYHDIILPAVSQHGYTMTLNHCHGPVSLRLSLPTALVQVLPKRWEVDQCQAAISTGFSTAPTTPNHSSSGRACRRTTAKIMHSRSSAAFWCPRAPPMQHAIPCRGPPCVWAQGWGGLGQGAESWLATAVINLPRGMCDVAVPCPPK